MRQDVWFPAAESRTVVGRFVDVESVDAAASREKNEEVTFMRPALESKVIGSHDISFQLVKPFNLDDLKKRFPGAYESYLEAKALPEPDPVVHVIRQTVPGTSLDKVDFLPRDRMPWLVEQGVQTVEQLRDLSDMQVQNMGRGAAHWRKQAKAFLERT